MNKDMRKYHFEPGLIKTIKEADDGRGYFSTTKVQVNYDPSTGKVWGDWCIGNEWREYHDRNIINAGRFAGKVTRVDIINAIEEIEAERGKSLTGPAAEHAQPANRW